MPRVYFHSELLADIAGGLSDLRAAHGPGVGIGDAIVVLWAGPERRLGAVELADALDALADGYPEGDEALWGEATEATVERRPSWQRAPQSRKYV